jgi:hypothetical protein
MDEYFILVDAYKTLTSGKKLSPLYAEILNINTIPLPGKVLEGFIFADDPIIVLDNGNGLTYRFDVSYLGRKLSDITLYGTPIDSLYAVVQDLLVRGAPPETHMGLRHQDPVIQSLQGREGGYFAVTTGGFSNPATYQELRGVVASSGGNPGQRMVVTRRRQSDPMAHAHSVLADGRHRFTLLHPTQMEKSMNIPERLTHCSLTDWQTGSDTGQTHLIPIVMDIIAEAAKTKYVSIGWLGDHKQHVNIYRGAQAEMQLLGLTRSDSQEDWLIAILEPIFDHMTTQQLESILMNIITPGNHEWRRDKEWGISSIRWLEDLLLRKIEGRLGPIEAKKRVLLASRFESETNSIPDWIAVYNFYKYRILQTHLMYDGKGHKSNSLPILGGHSWRMGNNTVFSEVDLIVTGHLHNFSVAMAGPTAVIICPALANSSPFEVRLGYRPTVGFTTYSIGGGLPPEIEFWPDTALYNHKIASGPFSSKQLLSEGYSDDPHFDPYVHGLSSRRSALMQKVLALKDGVTKDLSNTSTPHESSPHYLDLRRNISSGLTVASSF